MGDKLTLLHPLIKRKNLVNLQIISNMKPLIQNGNAWADSTNVCLMTSQKSEDLTLMTILKQVSKGMVFCFKNCCGQQIMVFKKNFGKFEEVLNVFFDLYKVSFFGHCIKMQLIPLQNFIIKTCFIQFL